MRRVKVLMILVAIVACYSAMAQSSVLPDYSSGNIPPKNESLKMVKLYPNPAVEYVSLKFESPQARKVKFSLHNIIGSEMPVEFEIVDDYEVLIKVKEFSVGVYLLSIRNDETGSKNALKFLKK